MTNYCGCGANEVCNRHCPAENANTERATSMTPAFAAPYGKVGVSTSFSTYELEQAIEFYSRMSVEHKEDAKLHGIFHARLAELMELHDELLRAIYEPFLPKEPLE